MKIDTYADEYIYTHWMDAPGAVDATARAGYIAGEDMGQIREDIKAGVVDGNEAAIAAALLRKCIELSAKGEYDELTTTELQEIYEQECRAQGLDPAEQADACLAIGREFLPPAALAVLDGEEPTGDYWDWLHTQVVSQLPEDHWMPTHLNGGLSG